MSKLVFVTGGFSSGTTLMWTIFRQSGKYHALYEPLHERLLEYLIWPLRPYEHHYFVKNYFSEYKGFDKIPFLFKPEWGNSYLYIPEDEPAEDLYRYIKYLIDTSFKYSDRVLLQFNRATFRLKWLRKNFPEAKVVHIFRDKDSQWNSIVRRVQAYHGKTDVGQDSAMFYGMNMAGWCEDLKSRFPQLSAENSKTGYERFSKLWQLSYDHNASCSDLTINLSELLNNFETTCTQIFKCVECDVDIATLKHYVVPLDKQNEITIRNNNIYLNIIKLVDKSGFKMARIWIKFRKLFSFNRWHLWQ